jgi:diguanylate cyclase (GGDEF)-like protein
MTSPAAGGFSKHLLRLTLTLAAALSLLILGGLSWNAYHGYRYAEAQLSTIGRMGIVRAEIVHLDEVLTMSARMAAATGNLDWETRYRRFEPQLDQSIKEALRLNPDTSRGAAAAKTDAANVALVAMEHRAFDLVRQGKNAEAQRLLSSGEYEAHKNIYVAGMTEFNRHLLLATDLMRVELQADMFRSAITTIASAVLLILGSLFAFLATRRWQAVIVESNRQLNQKTAELRELNNQLDRKVSERTQELNESVRQHQLAAGRAEYLAYYDSLTALPNRTMFSKLVQQAISLARRGRTPLAVLFVDLDRFKTINDTLGHDAGDLLLQEVAERLQACLRESDTVARLGGDEFVVLLPALRDAADVEVVARKILAATSKSFLVLGREFRVTASVGISTYPQDGEDEQSLMKNADIAMYQAKEDGKNNFRFYSIQMNTHSLERLSLESSLRRALEHDEFRLHYQPKIDARSDRIVGIEALLRWQHPELGLVAPTKFIPIAEETGLIVSIGKWVLNAACRQNMAWQQSGLPRLSMAVNLSARQFSDEQLLRDITSILEETGMSPGLLELEIAEATLMHDIGSAMVTLKAFRDMGVRLAIDNFGTGYASLSQLKQFPVDTIKIDASFFRDLSSHEHNSGIVEAIIAMGRSLSMTVIAERVETKAQVDFLRQRSCDEFQGFYFSKAVTPNKFAELLEAQTTAQAEAA